jgi:hypothetical protein
MEVVAIYTLAAEAEDQAELLVEMQAIQLILMVVVVAMAVAVAVEWLATTLYIPFIPAMAVQALCVSFGPVTLVASHQQTLAIFNLEIT